MLTIKVDTRGVTDMLGRIKRELRPAVARAINQTVVDLEKAEKAEMQRAFDRPIPFTVNSPFYKQRANERHLNATLGIKDIQAKYLRLQIEGGTIPVLLKPVKIRLDRYGNIPPSAHRQGLAGIAAKGKQRFVAEINGVTGVWERHGRGGKRVRLLVRVAKQEKRTKRFRFYEVGKATGERQLRRHMAREIAAVLRRR